MDFRSQLSAFQNNSGGRGNNNSNNNRDNRNDGYRSSNRRNENNSNYGRPFGGGGRTVGERGGSSGEGFEDRRRPRPPEWGISPNYGGGPPPNTRPRLNPTSGAADGLGDLRRFGFRIPIGFPDPPGMEEKNKKSKHIALLAITIDDLPYEHLWRGWCETLKSARSEECHFISLVCHAKYPKKVKSEWLQQRLLIYPPKRGRGNSFEDPTFLTRTPAWGSIDITRAMLDLLQEGLKIGNCTQTDKRFSADRFLAWSPPKFGVDKEDSKIPPVDHFLYISETCLPVATAPEFFSKIDNVNVSWVNARHRKQEDTPRNKYEDDQFAGISRRLPGQYRWKADQWVLLSRRHASQIIEMDRPHIPPKHQIWKSFQDINASDEMFFPTALALLGYLRFTKDGDDTQKSRATIPTSAGSTNSCSIQTVTVATAPSSDSGAAGSASVASPPLNKNDCILLRPVTYTDWSQGMKNPATFCHGTKDLKRVGKLAREKGCLVARKFATHVAIPGVPQNEQQITGEISVEQWEEIILEIQKRETNSDSSLPYSSQNVKEKGEMKENEGGNESDEKKGTTRLNDRKDEELHSSLNPLTSKPREEEINVDEDQGETQLE